MKNKLLYGIISVAILLTLLFSTVSCIQINKIGDVTSTASGTNEPESPTATTASESPTVTTTPEPTTATTEPEAPVLQFGITSEYRVIRPDYNNDSEIAAIQLMSRGLKSAAGIDVALTTDFLKPDAGIVPSEFEILVGPTNRPQSQAVKSELSALDYTYRVVSKNVIVICGGSPEATYQAVEKFLSDVYGYTENASKTVTSAGKDAQLDGNTEFLYSHKYSVTDFRLGGNDIETYKIVSPQGESSASKALCTAIGKLCGYTLETVKPENFTSGNAIYLGCADSNGKHLDRIFDSYSFYITTSGKDIIIDYKNNVLRDIAVAEFVAKYIPESASGKLNIGLDFAEYRGVYLKSQYNALSLTKTVTDTLATGVNYTEKTYTDADGKPVRAYILEVAKNSASLYTGTPEDGKVLLNKGGTVKAEMQAAVSNGVKVLAGVNADFFDISGNYLPRGLCIKNGEVLHGTGSRPWFGVTKDGTPVIGSAADYSKYEGLLQTAVGGSQVIIRDGLVADIGSTGSFETTRHPRTAVGFCEDGTVIIIVVDGRQSEISNGASMADLALMFCEYGCQYALNLDGGGSSCMIIRDGSTYRTENSPSDGGLRKIQSSLLVVLP